MNALYADAEGRVLDPVGGLPDLRAGRVRFIGGPEARIREDYLRILRFFRFSAWYGRNGIDAEGLAACAALAEGVEGLARERVGHEMRKLLAAPDPAPAVAAMAAAGVLARVLPGADAAVLAPLVHLEGEAGAAPDWLRRLAALGAEDAGGALRLSRAEDRALRRIAGLAGSGEAPALLAEEGGAEAARSAVLVRSARAGLPLPPGLGAELARGATAEFPLAAADLMAAGWAPGPGLGRALAEARALWRRSGFRMDRDALLAALAEGADPG
jgi:poly(A) polymerase